jgi:hypothetical protein
MNCDAKFFIVFSSTFFVGSDSLSVFGVMSRIIKFIFVYFIFDCSSELNFICNSSSATCDEAVCILLMLLSNMNSF